MTAIPLTGQLQTKFGLLLTANEYHELFALLQWRIDSLRAEARASGDPAIAQRIAVLHNLLARLAFIGGVQLPEEQKP